MAVVTIARQYGAGARMVGRMIAERLGYRMIDKAILDQVARKADVSLKQVEDIEKMGGDRLLTFLSEAFSTSPRFRHLPGISAEFDEQKYVFFLKKAIADIADRGKAVIIGRGGQFILRDHPKVVRVYLVAEEEDRIKNLMNAYQMGRSKAEAVVRREEKKREAFLEKFGSGSSVDLLIYHLVINTSLVDYDMAADLICHLVSAKEKL
jgi:cytidylate kinase